MNRQNGITIALVVIAVAIVLTFGFFVRIAPIADMVAALDTAGMTCGTCSDKITKSLMKNNGVASVGVDLNAGKVLVAYSSEKTTPTDLARKVTALGYRSTVVGMIAADEFTKRTGIPVHKLRNSGSGGCGGGCGTR